MPRGLQEVILKSRQFGFSTLIAALFFCDTVNNPGTTTVIVAQNGKAAENLFQIVHRFWRNLPDEKRPHKEYSSKTELFFDKIDSRYLVFTAGGESAAASFTIQNLHCSEAALYPSGDFWETTIPAIPEGHGNIFVESTARGEAGRGETFCRMYREAKASSAAMDALSGAGDTRSDDDVLDDDDERSLASSYTARFFAWWEHDEYEAQASNRLARTDEEITIAERYGLDALYGRERADAKLRWRRLRISKMSRKGQKFAQEFPGDDKEAFLVNGARFFPEWDESVYVYAPTTLRVESYWRAIGGYDWGYAVDAPAVFLLARVDEMSGGVVLVDEITITREIDPKQAAAVVECLRGHGLKPDDVPIYADPSMWNPKSDPMGRVFQAVQPFYEAGLQMVKASNERVSGWQNLRRYLAERASVLGPTGEPQEVPALRISRRCANVIRTFPLHTTSDKNPHDCAGGPARSANDLRAHVHSHWLDTLRYLLSGRPMPSEGLRKRDDNQATAESLLNMTDYELKQLGFHRDQLTQIAGGHSAGKPATVRRRF